MHFTPQIHRQKFSQVSDNHHVLSDRLLDCAHDAHFRSTFVSTTFTVHGFGVRFALFVIPFSYLKSVT